MIFPTSPPEEEEPVLIRLLLLLWPIMPASNWPRKNTNKNRGSQRKRGGAGGNKNEDFACVRSSPVEKVGEHDKRTSMHPLQGRKRTHINAPPKRSPPSWRWFAEGSPAPRRCTVPDRSPSRSIFSTSLPLSSPIPSFVSVVAARN